MADYGHRESDRRLAELERRIDKEYRQAYTEIKAKADEFFEKFRDKDKELSQKVKQGEISKSDYIEWRRKAMIKGNSLKNLEKSLAQDLVNADRIAGQMISGHKVDVYALNRNYGEYEIENALNIDLSFSLYDHKTVEKLIKDQPALLPTQLDEVRDLKWNRQKVSSAITQGILQGESIPNIGKRLRKVVGMDKTASIRNARTATTGAENAGRVDSYEEAESKGVELEKKWVATLDQRTRSEHRQLDGQTCPIHDKFKVDGEEIEYPGDPQAAGHLVYNCRCTLVADIKGIEYKDVRWDRLPEGMSYEEWKNYKTETKQTSNVSKRKAPATTEEANKELKNLLKANYENHRILNNTSSVPIAKFGDDTPFMTADYGKLSVETANTFNKALSNLMEEYDTPLTSVRVMTKMEYFASQHSFAYVSHDYTVDNATLVINPIKCKNLQDMTNRIIELADNGYSVAIPTEKASEYVITHEFAHTVINMRDQLKDKTNWVNSDYDKIRKARKEIKPIYERYMAETESLTRIAKDNELKYLTSKDPKAMQEYADKSIKAYDDLEKVKLSDYSMSDIDEFMAESFTNEKIGIKSNPYSKEVKEVIDKYFRRSKK